MMMTPAGWPVTTTRFGQVSKPLNKLINEMGAATIEMEPQALSVAESIGLDGGFDHMWGLHAMK